MPFLNEVELERVGPRTWVTDEDLFYLGKRDLFQIRAEFQSDLYSFPQSLQSGVVAALLPRWVVEPRGRHPLPARLHDWLYRTRPFVLDPGGAHRPITRKEADGIFRRAMGEEGVSWWRRRARYWGVRLGGWAAWRRARQALA